MTYPACSINEGQAASPTAPYVEVFPEVAHAALKAKEHHQLTTWLVLRANDPSGTARVSAVDAGKLIAGARGVSQRQARRLLEGGEARYWTKDRGGHIRYFRASRVCWRLGVERVSRLRRVRIADLGQGQAALEATFAATAYRADDRGTPLTRRRLRELTGIPESSQRRYENVYSHSELVEPVYTRITNERPVDQASRFAQEGVWGFFRGRHGQLIRRRFVATTTCTL